jgi:hypothetical protein
MQDQARSLDSLIGLEFSHYPPLYARRYHLCKRLHARPHPEIPNAQRPGGVSLYPVAFAAHGCKIFDLPGAPPMTLTSIAGS